MMTKIKTFFSNLPINSNQLLTVAGVILGLSLIVILKPFSFLKSAGSLSDLIASFFFIFATGVIMLQIFFKKNNTAEKALIDNSIKNTQDRQKALKEKEKEVIDTLKSKKEKSTQTKKSIKTIEAEKEALTQEKKTRKPRKPSTKSAADKLKNL